MTGDRIHREVFLMRELLISCLEVRREMSNYIEDDVSLELRARIDSHVEACNGCRAIFDGVRNVIRLVGARDVIELPREFSRRLYARVRARIVC